MIEIYAIIGLYRSTKKLLFSVLMGVMINPDERGTKLVFRRQGTSYTGKDIQSPRGWFTADFSVRKTAARMSK